MSALKHISLSAALLALGSALPAIAQDQVLPTIEMQSTSASVGIGGQSGNGVLRLPTLGTNCAYRFAVSGFGAGIQVGISRANAAGVVANMRQVSELAGSYAATQGEATLIAGSGSTSMKNQANAVVIGLNSRTARSGSTAIPTRSARKTAIWTSRPNGRSRRGITWSAPASIRAGSSPRSGAKPARWYRPSTTLGCAPTATSSS
jgi:hypothetical protein